MSEHPPPRDEDVPDPPNELDVPDPPNELDVPAVDDKGEPPHLRHGSPHDDEPEPYDAPNPNVP